MAGSVLRRAGRKGILPAGCLRVVAPTLLVLLSGVRGSDAAQVISTQSGACVEVQGGNVADGTPVDVYQCTGSLNQTWTLTGGQVSGIGGGCLDVNLDPKAPRGGGSVILVQCNGRPSQQWAVTNGQIIGLGGKCLGMMGSGGSLNTPLTLSVCSTAPGQKWLVQ